LGDGEDAGGDPEQEAELAQTGGEQVGQREPGGGALRPGRRGPQRELGAHGLHGVDADAEAEAG
jgi:hypothetical protein